MPRIFLAALLLIGSGLGQVSVAQTKASEMAGAKDHPMISRYAGSVLQNAAQENFVALRVPGGRASGRSPTQRLRRSSATCVSSAPRPAAMVPTCL